MNERIKKFLATIDVNPKIRELAEQSGCSIDKMGYGEGNLESFAELIVRECIEVVRDIQQDYDGGSTTVFASDEIKQHFGLDVL